MRKLGATQSDDALVCPYCQFKNNETADLTSVPHLYFCGGCDRSFHASCEILYVAEPVEG